LYIQNKKKNTLIYLSFFKQKIIRYKIDLGSIEITKNILNMEYLIKNKLLNIFISHKYLFTYEN
ncbi:hypothetical protein BWK63_08460, partial [Flavobacterium covae]